MSHGQEQRWCLIVFEIVVNNTYDLVRKKLVNNFLKKNR